MNGRTHRFKLIVGIVAACVALSSIAPSFAQSGPALGSWTAGPDGQGPSTIVGRIEAPRAGQRALTSSNLLVTGWAADTTASGWAGFDGMEVWNGAKDNSSSAKLATGNIGQPRPDVADALGGSFVNSGFSAIVPASALQALSGSVSLYVYLHTPGKGTWYRNVSVSISAGPTLAFPGDPIVTFTHPLAGEIITSKQKNNKYSLQGFALDRNPAGPGQNPGGGASGCHCGISTLFLYADLMPGQPGYTTANDLGVGNVGPCGIGCGFGPYVNNAGGRGPAVDVQDSGQGGQSFPNASYVTAQYGSQFNLSGFSFSINPNNYNPNIPISSSNLAPNTFHTFYAVATSSITGKVSVATTTLYIRGSDNSFQTGRAVAP